MSYKIALISAFPPGNNSLNEYGYHLAMGFAEHPDVSEVVVLADVLETEQDELELPSNVRVERVWSFNAMTSSTKIVKKLRSEAPDLALFNLQVASFGDKELPAGLGLLTPAFSRLFGVYSGVLSHNVFAEISLEDTVLKGQPLRQKIVGFGVKFLDWGLLKANYTTFTLDTYANSYQKRFPKASIHHVPHGIFDTKTRELTPFEVREKIIVTMGKFGTYKRLETLLEAIEIVRQDETHHDLQLIIGGTDHPNHQGYMTSVQEANAHKDYVHFCGYVPEADVAEFFGQARLSVFDYSSTTGSSGVLHQTASYGAVPVFPAIGDFVALAEDEGLRGLNYEPNDAQSLAEAIKRGLQDPKASAEIGESNRKAAEDMPFSEIIDFHMNRVKKHKVVK